MHLGCNATQTKHIIQKEWCSTVWVEHLSKPFVTENSPRSDDVVLRSYPEVSPETTWYYVIRRWMKVPGSAQSKTGTGWAMSISAPQVGKEQRIRRKNEYRLVWRDGGSSLVDHRTYNKVKKGEVYNFLMRGDKVVKRS